MICTTGRASADSDPSRSNGRHGQRPDRDAGRAATATIQRRFQRKYTAKIAGVTLTAIARPMSRPASASEPARSSCARYRPAISGSRATKFVCPSCMSRTTGSHQPADDSATADAVSRAPHRDDDPGRQGEHQNASGSFTHTHTNCAAGRDSAVNGATAAG